MSTKEITVSLHLEDQEAWDLAQFVKRIGWVEYRQNAASDEEAYRISHAVARLERALKEAGYAPR
jgi:cytochrome c